MLGAGAMALFVIYNIMSLVWNLQSFISPGFPNCIPSRSQQVYKSIDDVVSIIGDTLAIISYQQRRLISTSCHPARPIFF